MIINAKLNILIYAVLLSTPIPLLAASPEFVFHVTEPAGIARSNEVVCSGLPLPRQANVRSTNQLQVATLGGTALQASFHVLARWNAGLNDTNAPIQWVLAELPVTVGAYQTNRYQLVITESTNAPPATNLSLRVTRTNDQIRVETGAATFFLGANPNMLFDEIRLPDGTQAATGTCLQAVANGTTTLHAVSRRIAIERQSPLSAVVVIDGAYDLPATGGGAIASSRRYQFFAGAPTALIRHEVAWEGSLFSVGTLAWEGTPNGVRIQRIRNALDLPLTLPCQTLVWGDAALSPIAGPATTGTTVSLEQRLRAQCADQPQYRLDLGAAQQTGRTATGGMIAFSDGTRTVAAAFNHMDRYEPQALRWTTNHCIAVDLASDNVWLGARQGLFGQFGITATPGNINTQQLKSALWAKVNYPLHAWPDAAWFAASKAVEEFPVGPLADATTNYDLLLPSVLSNTTNLIDTLGLRGLQTYGLFPRYWGAGWNELTNSPPDDPTPDELWDDLYWGATWTDYHNTSALAAYWAMRSGTCRWLDDISFPAALRMLHTQIIHGAPEDDYFYIGQSPCGYGGYRADFNSSHAYFDNLILYYWLTGDYTVVETLTRGATTMRQYYYPERPDVPCDPLRPPANEWAHPVGRVASQWNQVYRFIGLASTNASFLDDFRGNLARAVSQYYAELQKDGRTFGFWCSTPLADTGASTTNNTDQLWMVSLYDMNLIHRLLIETEDAPIGIPPRRPSEILSAWANTLAYLAPNADTNGDGTLNGPWPTFIQFTWSGNRIGGQLETTGGYFLESTDHYLWESGKASLAAILARAAHYTSDSGVQQLAEELAARVFGNAWNNGAPLPLGKEQGITLTRLHSAVARIGMAEPLKLRIERQTSQIILQWPTPAQSWRLETTDSLTSRNWHVVSNGGRAMGTVLPLQSTNSTFYRLTSP